MGCEQSVVKHSSQELLAFANDQIRTFVGPGWSIDLEFNRWDTLETVVPMYPLKPDQPDMLREKQDQWGTGRDSFFAAILVDGMDPIEAAMVEPADFERSLRDLQLEHLVATRRGDILKAASLELVYTVRKGQRLPLSDRPQPVVVRP